MFSAIGDFLGFDGSFGYQGPEGRHLSLSGLGHAVLHVGAEVARGVEHIGGEIVHGVEHAFAGETPAARGGGNQPPNTATDISLDPGDSDVSDALTTLASAIYTRHEDGNVYYTWGGQVDPDSVAQAEAGLWSIGYEPYDPRPLDELNLLQLALIGMDAHQVLTDIAGSPANFRAWFANRSIVPAAGIRFDGRVDLGSLLSREIWELKPDNTRAILSGELQVVGYVNSQTDLRDIPFFVTHNLANPFRVAQQSPQAAGLVGLEDNVGHPGRYGWYTYRYAGNGVEAYTWTGNGSLDWLSSRITRVPNFWPGPLPGRRDDTAPSY